MAVCFLYKSGGRSSGGIREIPKTALGTVIALTDSANRPLRGLKVFGRTEQNGTPTPDAPVPLESVGDGGSVSVTVGGKNLFSAEWEQGSIDSDAGNENNDSTIIRCGYIPVVPSMVYALSRTITSNFMNVRGYDADKTYIGSGSKVIALIQGSSVGNPMGVSADKCVIKINADVHYLRFCDKSNDLSTLYQMELGSTATAYEPYKETNTVTVQKPEKVPVFLPGIPVTSGGNYTDANGQRWICDEVDFEKGMYVQRVGSAKLGNLNWSVWGGVFITKLTDFPVQKVGEKSTLMCDRYTVTNGKWASSVASMADKEIAGGAGTAGELFIKDSVYTDAVSFKNAMLDTVILYELTTAIPHDLSPDELAQYAALHTNYPNTTIFNDGGAEMEVKYLQIGGQ